jgi:hypothetical protein
MIQQIDVNNVVSNSLKKKTLSKPSCIIIIFKKLIKILFQN